MTDTKVRSRNRLVDALRDAEQWDFDGYVADMQERAERQLEWLQDNPGLPELMGFTTEEAVHAKKVLTRLVSWGKF